MDGNEDEVIMAAKCKVPTIKELREVAGARRRRVGKTVSVLQFTTAVHRPISIYFTKLFLMAGIGPDTVTLISYVFAVATGILFIFGNYWLILIGIVLHQFYSIFDESDGDVSRYMYGVNNNPRGEFMEYMGHSLYQPFLVVCIAFGVYNNPNSILVGPLFYNNIIVLVIGFIGSNLFLALHMLDGLLKSRFSDVVSDEVPASPANEPGPLQYLFAALGRFRVLSNKYIFGDLLLLITAVSNTLWLYLFIWTITHLPIILVNLLMSYRRLPMPQLLEQETGS